MYKPNTSGSTTKSYIAALTLEHHRLHQYHNNNSSSNNNNNNNGDGHKMDRTPPPPLVLNPHKRAPLLKIQTHNPSPEPTLPIKQHKTHPKAATSTTTTSTSATTTPHAPTPAQAQATTPHDDRPSSSSSSGAEGSVFFIGTATTLLQWHGVRVLTDPNLLHAGDHVHLGPGVTARRVTEPAVVGLAALPPVDCVLLSHYHEDHFDRDVERDLGRDVPIVTTPHARGCLTRGKEDPFRRVVGLDVWERLVMPVVDGDSGTGEGEGEGEGEGWQPAVRVTGLPGKHVPPGALAKANELLGAVPPTNGWLVELGWTTTPATRVGDEDGFDTGYRIYISGDTLFVDELREIPARLRGERVDLMLAHLGGTTIPGPRLPLLMVTMDAEQGVRLMRLVDPDVTVPIHYDDYDVFLSPLDDFRRAVDAAGLGDRVVYLDRGDEYRFAVRGARRGK